VGTPEFVVGEVIDEKYQLEALLGRSGPLATYRAVAGENRHVVLKFYDPALEAFPEVVNALSRCETVTSELPAELVVRIVDGGKDPVSGAPYTVTEPAPESSLADLAAWTPLAVPEMVAFIQSLSRALDAVHARGIAHLSLKPTNVFVGPAPTYHVRLADFAMSRVRSVLPSADEGGASAQWLAPEQERDGGGPAADVFASALLAFYALTGTSYWRSLQSDIFDESAWRAELLGSRTPVSHRARELSISIDASFDPVFERALAISPRYRFGTAGEFAAALAAAIEAGGAPSLAGTSVVPKRPEPDFLITDPARPAPPTSTSAVVIAPALLVEDPTLPTAKTERPPVDVPPPPAQMEAVLAEFEVAAPERFHIDDDPTHQQAVEPKTSSAPVEESVVVHVRTGLSTPPRRNWSPLFWTAGVAAGLVAAVGIVYPIVANKGTSKSEAPTFASSPAVAAPSSQDVPPTPASAIAKSADPGPSIAAAITAPAKPASKTVRAPAPAQSRGASPAAPRKPCSKGKPCK
jgi:serine/threonine protein kinase